MTMLTPRTPAELAPPGRSRRERRAAELQARTRLVGERLAGISARSGVQVLQEVDASPAGLTHAEAALRLERHGANVVAHERAPAGTSSWPRRSGTPSSPSWSSSRRSCTGRTPRTRASSSSP